MRQYETLQDWHAFEQDVCLTDYIKFKSTERALNERSFKMILVNANSPYNYRRNTITNTHASFMSISISLSRLVRVSAIEKTIFFPDEARDCREANLNAYNKILNCRPLMNYRSIAFNFQHKHTLRVKIYSAVYFSRCSFPFGNICSIVPL